MKTIFAVLSLLTQIATASPSDDKRMSCLFDSDSGGGGRADITISSTGWTELSASALAAPYLHLAFTRVFSELGVIGLTEHVVAVSYADSRGSHCKRGLDTRDVVCKENLGQIAIVTHRRDQANVTHERKFTVPFDSVELISQRTDDGATWIWEFVKDGKWAYTNVINLWSCEYGTHHWDN